MLLGHDPVAYFTEGKPVRGTHDARGAPRGRTYYFSTPEHRVVHGGARVRAAVRRLLLQRRAYAVKLGSDPTEFEIRDGRLFIFGDVMGHEMWKLDERDNIRHADSFWPEIRDVGWRGRRSRMAIPRAVVPDEPELMVRWREKHPGRISPTTPAGSCRTCLQVPGMAGARGLRAARAGRAGEG
jgi:hypothetical protein